MRDAEYKRTIRQTPGQDLLWFMLASLFCWLFAALGIAVGAPAGTPMQERVACGLSWPVLLVYRVGEEADRIMTSWETQEVAEDEMTGDGATP
jgi:hypothetical protein